MLYDVTRLFPADWRFTAHVERGGGTDKWGALEPATKHTVPDCLISTIRSEDVPRSDDPETTAWIYAPVEADFAAGDTVTVEPQPGVLSGRFVVTGRPSSTPMGTSVPLMEG